MGKVNMKSKLSGKMNTVLAALIAFIMLFNAAGLSVYADDGEEDDSGVGKGKYVSDVFIAYGKTEADAKKWLVDNSWEPINGDCDLNAGKASFFDDNMLQDQNVAAVMGIRRTDEAEEAVTDMAVMNMKGGYSIPDYESLIKEKKADITELINSYIPVIKEFRDNYNGKGSEFGQKRAKLTYDLLNRFYDGGDEYAMPGDTGKKIGDIFLAKTTQEGNDKGGDLQKIILESSGPAMLTVEVLLALSADSGEDLWLTRVQSLTGDDLAKNLTKYVPEAEGQDIAPSAVNQFLKQHFGDTAKTLAKGWQDVHDEFVWFDKYNKANDLWQKHGESDDAYKARLDAYFDGLIKEDKETGEETRSQYELDAILYNGLHDIEYPGDWGTTMGDLFDPADGSDMSGKVNAFLPMAATLSDGQKASLDLVSLSALLLMGLGTEDAFDKALPDIKSIFKGNTDLSIYTGVDRSVFRGGVALTSQALMEQNIGRSSSYVELWGNTGILAISSYAAAALSVVAIIGGAVMKAKGITYLNGITKAEVQNAAARVKRLQDRLKDMESFFGKNSRHYRQSEGNLEVAKKQYNYYKSKEVPSKMGIAGRWVMGIGGALLVGASVVKGVQLYKYYKRDMTPIPNMIVDESDIVTYQTDENGDPVTDESGNQKKNIDFNTFEYYTAVLCNRQEVGEIGDWQSGVEEYASQGCGDVADMNADMGQEWLALYTVKSSSKGAPVLADSLKLQYGSKDMPDDCTNALHMFEFTNPMDLGDTAYAYNNAKKGIYLFWKEEESSYDVSSAFTQGTLAMAAACGAAIGVIITLFVLMPKKKKETF